MRTFFIVSCLAGAALSVSQAAEPDLKSHPGVVALSQTATGEWIYRSFPQLTTLYVNDKDRPGKSLCNEKCMTAWPPLSADDSERGVQVGHWSVIARDDGKAQWAYKNQPVYLRFHDMPTGPHAIEVEGFRELEP